jgi:glycine oxidase
MIDYLIIGSGLAGIAFAELALQNNKTIKVYENHSQNSSTIAGGLYNPVILKRFSEVWKSQEQIDIVNHFYARLEAKLSVALDFKIPIYRRLYSVAEQNDWFVASDKPNLAPFLSTTINYNHYNGIDSPFGFGEVLQSGYVDTAMLLRNYQHYLLEKELLVFETFDYGQLQVESSQIVYQGQIFKHVIFAEGFGLHSNPYFSRLPLDGTKGELLIIKAPDLGVDVIVQSSVFIIPLGNHLFKVGSTYNWEDKTAIPTEEGKKELVDKLRELIYCDFEVMEHLAGIRPTVKDRKPMIGTHPKYASLHVLNGMGTRGVMLAPAMAKELYEHLEFGKPIDPTVDIKRYKKISWD